MLSVEQYGGLHSALAERGLSLINSPEEYRHCHFLPESFELIRAKSPASVWVPLGEDGMDVDVVVQTANAFWSTDPAGTPRGAKWSTPTLKSSRPSSNCSAVSDALPPSTRLNFGWETPRCFASWAWVHRFKYAWGLLAFSVVGAYLPIFGLAGAIGAD